MPNLIWETRSGSDLRPTQMSTEHICNSMRLLEERGVMLWPLLKEVRERIDRHSQPGISPRVMFVLSRCRRIAQWIYVFREELRHREGIEGLTALELYDRHYSIVEDYDRLELSPLKTERGNPNAQP